MDLSLYDVIKGPVISDKAYKLNKKQSKLVLKVHPKANKPLVTEAVEKLFNVKVDNVRMVTRQGKTRMVKRIPSKGKTTKKAIVTLAEGYSLDLMDQAGTTVSSSEGKK